MIFNRIRNSLVFLFFTSLGVFAANPLVVNDVTQLNPIAVKAVVAPTTVAEIVRIVKEHAGPISIGGGRFSMGGQTATEGAVQIDMRSFDKVVSFSKEKKEITVQAGITWRKIQEFIDAQDLSLQIMQTYANFTVGGSLSVNCHGRYVGQGPLVLSVKAIKVVLADGSLASASPSENSELFYSAIGGYGGMGVIVEATLALTDNCRVERKNKVMPLAAYKDYFFKNIRGNSNFLFHNADIYPNDYTEVNAVSYERTEKPVTVKDRLIPKNENYFINHLIYWVISEWPFGKVIRQKIVDPIVFSGRRVEWRNYEASYDVRELEPASRKNSTYVLNEYFVPVEQLDAFVPKMAEILKRHKVNVMNVSIRHAEKDPGVLLAWAKTEVFAFVLYYKQGTSEAEKKKVAVWTRELIAAAISFGGSYYLPYQIHATPEQFHTAYPRADAFFAMKKKMDPENKFRNKLWDAYYLPSVGVSVKDQLAKVPGYRRDEGQTYITFPEWYLVYSPAEYAEWMKSKPPSGFPYFGAIGQFWNGYHSVYGEVKGRYPFNWGYHFMIWVIGTSFTVEMAGKGIYEATLGKFSEWVSENKGVAEDRFAAKVAQDYVDFIRVDPWYDFAFAKRLRELWKLPHVQGESRIRILERKLFLSAEYGIKAVYATLITLGTKSIYGDADDRMLLRAHHVSLGETAARYQIKTLATLADGSVLLSLPRYEAFREAVVFLAKSGASYAEIAGNHEILITALVPATWTYSLSSGREIFKQNILTNPRLKRIGIRTPVADLHRVLLGLGAVPSGILEHVYDY